MPSNKKSLIGLLKKNLPKDVNIFDEKYEYRDYKNINDEINILIKILKETNQINWEAYLENNQDVKISNMDPVEHYLLHGIYEGRKITSNNVNAIAANIGPDVSIIIPNFNNCTFLRKCLSSVCNQSLKNIEIIVIDDCSTDNSVKIIKDFCQRDNRIKLIEFKSNRSANVARITGIEASSGKYIMFVDPDDFLQPDACEIAIQTIKRGYDIVGFGANIINQAYMDKKDVEDGDKYLNRAVPGFYTRDEMYENIFLKQNLTFTLWNKIYVSGICKKGIEKLKKDFIPVAQDLYAFLAITSMARNIYIINNKLYNYNYGIGVSFPGSAKEHKNRQIDRFIAVKYIRELLKNSFLDSYIPIIENKLFIGGFLKTYEKLINEDRWIFLRSYFDNYGIIQGLSLIINAFYNNPDIISKRLENNDKWIQNIQHTGNNKKIGIFYFRIGYGGIETIIKNLCKLLINNGYEVHLFVEERSTDEILLDDRIKIYNIMPSGNNAASAIIHIKSLYKAIMDSKIKLIFHMWPSYGQFIWDTILYHYCNIKVITQMHSDLNWHFIYKKTGNQSHLATLSYIKCADKLICLSRYTELYMRSNQIDAIYIPNPIKIEENININDNKSDNIAIIGRLGDPGKRINESLEVFKQVLDKISNAKLFLIGGFGNSEQRQKIMDKINKLRITNNVIITGWTNNPEIYIKQCKIGLSTSYTEGFPLGISECQTQGLPCVIYDLPIELKRNNPSIITVPQGSIKDAANKIITILSDRSLYSCLRNIAFNKTRKYSYQQYSEKILSLIENLENQCSVRYYNKKDMADTIKYMTFYSGQRPPY